MLGLTKPVVRHRIGALEWTVHVRRAWRSPRRRYPGLERELVLSNVSADLLGQEADMVKSGLRPASSGPALIPDRMTSGNTFRVAA
ncbi:hypothetical protein [Acidomonas methanolica]|uniref:Uncharacterized protein n=2 Tax=Acidomonas methanolica TaxID=437 RepID=A0A023D5D4_ACIMT|nr:hypothetical protein [Acidomonas methanolica]MBU2655628.1 hypothetical protein [Acidomonas methanolica]BAN85809.1 hypothetical protein [Acidomonas methanolica]GAJ29269.1 hypothetical protein Amme_057_026 [Acidomonas methanolica NBRC 104435]GEK99896.1 hypothetical protein AME01nite_23950 [Acidomonas methanolica NBRC 104435]